MTTAPVPDWFTKALDALSRGDTAARAAVLRLPVPGFGSMWIPHSKSL
ncbi:hypothetical protein Psi02_54690 [Planotetraspora silvatica]|uniref:Uncharacterized protein n=1 Tax=Planotetraspora silvatica TaxID=234614 RepID=A0A8J3UQS1_9ACTN|nr:hypothetical protein Psi02_54690 [Planotetraspora silvatica]